MLPKMTLAAVSALALAAGCGQQAQTTENMPAETPPDFTAPAQAGQTHAEFVQAVANSDAFEIQSAEIAAQRGARADVKEFAQMMQRDHTATSSELTALAPQLNLPAPAPALDANHQAKLEALRNASGEAFDDAYLDQQVEAHENAVRMFESYLANAPQDQLRTWAETTLPKLRQHLEHVQRLENAT